MISIMESAVLREATVHESWSPHLRMQIKSSPILRGGGGLVELASSTSYLGNSHNMNPGDSSSPTLAETPGFRDQESPQTTMDSRMKKSKNHRNFNDLPEREYHRLRTKMCTPTVSLPDDMRPRSVKDPTSHRVIEKRRRDRMNNCLTNLSKLIPLAYLKKGRGRIEKTEIIEMAIRYMKHVDLERRQQLKRENLHLQDEFMLDKGVGTTDDELMAVSQGSVISSPDSTKPSNDRYKQGFFDCVAETVRFLVGAEGLIVNEQIKTKLLLHLRDYFTGLAYGSVDSKMNESKLNNYIINQNEEYTDDEPLNMSIKRPRPSNDIIRHCVVGQWTGVGGSQLRGILESKDNHTAVSSSSSSSASIKNLSTSDLNKIEIKHENVNYATSVTSNGAVPRSAPQALGAQIQHRFTSILEQPPASFIMPKAQNNVGNFSSQSSSSTQYPSSPSSSTSYCTDSPPEGHSPATNNGNNGGVSVPVFALHPLGLFYVPMIVNSSYLDSNFQSLLTSSFVDRSAEHVQSSLALSHPVTISVNFNFSTYNNGTVNHDHQHRLERSHAVQQSSVILTTSSLSRSTLQ